MPAHLRLELEAAVAAHLKQHRSKNYELVRDDPRFAAWTGTHLRHRGEKYFDRIVRVVEKAAKRKERLGQLPRLTECPQTGFRDRPATALATGGLSFEALLGDHAWQRQTLLREMLACFGDEGCLDDLERWRDLGAELRKVDKAAADLSKQYGAMMSGELADELIRLACRRFAHQPEDLKAFLADADAIVRQRSGLDGTKGASA
jgi:hypothetical protein